MSAGLNLRLLDGKVGEGRTLVISHQSPFVELQEKCVLLRIQCQCRVQSAAADPVLPRQTHTALVISGTTAELDD